MILTDSTKRAIRTLIHVLIAAATTIPTVLAGADSYAVLGQVVAVSAIVSKGFNMAEEAGLIPTWLKLSNSDAAALKALAQKDETKQPDAA